MRTFALLNNQEICRELGQRCRHLRLQANLTQLELAERTGASLSSIRRLEANGQATLELLVRVLQALHVSNQLENLLVLPTLSIADAEREAAVKGRQRAASPRRKSRFE